MNPFNALDKNEVLKFFNKRPLPPNAYVILFLGDSLTCHGPKENLWHHYNGMAATTYELDFVHLVAAGVQELLSPTPVEIQIYSTASIVEILEHLKTHVYLPDLVIFQGGENDPFDEVFRRCYRELITFFDRRVSSKDVDVIVLGDWYSSEKSEFDRKESLRAGHPFVDLFSIQSHQQNMGNGGPFNHPGVASHPNDAGMAAIFNAVMLSFRENILPNKSMQVTPEGAPD